MREVVIKLDLFSDSFDTQNTKKNNNKNYIGDKQAIKYYNQWMTKH